MEESPHQIIRNMRSITAVPTFVGGWIVTH
jgi:hypothetical protein